MTDIIPFMPELHDLPEAVQALKDARQRAFVWAYTFNGGNGSKAAITAGYSDKSEGAKVRAHGLLQRRDILDALRELGTRYLFSLQPKALSRLGQLLGSKNERVALKAVDMTLSRTGLSERTAVDVNVNASVAIVDHTSAAVADLRRLIELGVPREKLLETFGFSGLSRYEKLMAIEDRAKVIDAKFVEVTQNG